MVLYKELCRKCRKNYVKITSKEKYPVCYECQKKELDGKIKDSKMKKFFEIPEDFYRENNFLRSIKLNYLRYGNLSEKQIEAFKKTVRNMKQKS
ncbi:hypothetical protein J4414_03785 [Candidatus Woesearchaeota archaeon]|nr:hypothetical protein [Candidatus Woesearchaeota archaeon]